MCNIWKFPTKTEEEFHPSLLKKLPKLAFCNITGGEPFFRDDIDHIVDILHQKANRIVISTNGYETEKIVSLAKSFKNIGIRISIEGLPSSNDQLRGKQHCFDHALRTLLELRKIGILDIGFGITVSDKNAKDMLELYQLSKMMKVEFATAVVHNSFYFHKYDNQICNKEDVIRCFEELVKDLLETRRVKNWYRAYFNNGLINFIRGNPRFLPCHAGMNTFFLDPWGEVRPCNGMEEKIWCESMGNLNEKSFNEIFFSKQAERVRELVKICPKQCWMIGTAGPAMKKNIIHPTIWILKRQLLQLTERFL
jgi:Fe-coproporphyrin III synthase